MKEQFTTYRPKNKLVAKHISYYYYHQIFDSDFRRDFVYYPNFKNAITVHKDAVVERKPNFSQYFSKKGNSVIYYSINLNLRQAVQLNGKQDKIGIVFNPLGLNYFINCELSKISDKLEFNFDYFGEEFKNQLVKVYATSNFEKKVALLDAFFVKKYNPNIDNRIVLAVEQVINSKGTITTQEVADSLSISRKTLLRLFKTHLNCSIEDYKKLVRFRVTLNHYQSLEDKPKLSDIAYDNFFYDQANFINHFKSLIGKSPKSLFNSIEKLGDEDTYWTLKD